MKNFCKFLCGAISLFVLSCSENIDTIGGITNIYYKCYYLT